MQDLHLEGPDDALELCEQRVLIGVCGIVSDADSRHVNLNKQ